MLHHDWLETVNICVKIDVGVEMMSTRGPWQLGGKHQVIKGPYAIICTHPSPTSSCHLHLIIPVTWRRLDEQCGM